jgi:hypothetical protein
MLDLNKSFNAKTRKYSYRLAKGLVRVVVWVCRGGGGEGCELDYQLVIVLDL